MPPFPLPPSPPLPPPSPLPPFPSPPTLLPPSYPLSPPSTTPPLSTLSPGFACTVQDTVCEALGDFFNDTGGPSWRATTGWAAAAAGIATDYCSFVNVGCDGFGNVIRLSFFLGGLSGTIPTSISGLTALLWLDLGLNDRLTGTIPASLGQLTFLTLLDLCVASRCGEVTY